MSQQYTKLKFLSLALGATLTISLTNSAFGETVTNNNPFASHDAHSGTSTVAEMPKDGKCGEGKCSADMTKKPKDGKCGSADAPATPPKDAKCGGADKPTPPKQAKCGGM